MAISGLVEGDLTIVPYHITINMQMTIKPKGNVWQKQRTVGEMFNCDEPLAKRLEPKKK